MPHPLNNEQVDARLKNRKITRIEDFTNTCIPINFSCDVCGNIWKTAPKNLINKIRGCPECGKKKIGDKNRFTNEEIDEKLKDTCLIRKENYISLTTKILFECKVCSYQWKTTPSNIIHSKSSCARCAKNRKLTNEIIDLELINRNAKIKRIGECVNRKTPIEFLCLKCNNNFMSEPISYFACPQCSQSRRLTNQDIDLKLIGTKVKRIGNYIDAGIPIEFCCLNENCNNIWKTRFHKVGNECPRCARDSPSTFGNLTLEEAKIRLQKQQLRDWYVDLFCLDNKINIIWIDGRKYQFQNLERYFNETILPLLI